MRENDYEIGPIKMVLDDYERFILLRHDVDFYLPYAVELAENEHDLGIQSTYFILLHSPFYNALAPKSIEQIREIKKLGHEIGWHIDSNYNFDYDERRILLHIANANIDSFSLHLPSITHEKPLPYHMIDARDINIEYDIKYISDSGRFWREGCMCKHLNDDQHPRLQILTHPIWWITGMENRDLTIHHFIHSKLNSFNYNIKEYKTILREFLAGFGIAY